MAEPTAADPLHVVVQGVRVPTLVYGTAWKEDETARLTGLALAQGFRGIDTANQRRHYFEAGVGEAVREALQSGRVPRDELFLQTKFTFQPGQDHRLPYDPRAPLPEQVRQSFQSSLEHLGVEQLDSYVLHGPSSRHGWTADDRAAWGAMEALHREQRTRLLGVSNVSAAQLEALVAEAAVPPAFVQNRCYAVQGWDRAVRRLCARHGIVYQGFSLLTANPEVLAHPRVAAAARRTGATPEQVVFRFAVQVGMVALTGTTDAAHMQQDLAAMQLVLEDAEVRDLEAL